MSYHCTSRVLLVRPASFGFNAETASSNAFQRQPPAGGGDIQKAATAEFDALAGALKAAGVSIIEVADRPEPPKPDAVFPNNWVSFHDNGSVVLYPMQAVSRRSERSIEVLEQLARAGWIGLDRIIDLTYLESRGLFLEGTGSLVFDRVRAVAYAGISVRSDPRAIHEFSRATGIAVRTFATRDSQERPVYHTNVMLALGEKFAVVCAEAVAEGPARQHLLDALARSGRDIILITHEQMRSFAANILELEAVCGGRIIVMSSSAKAAFTPAQIARLRKFGDIVPVSIPTIENIGGGSVRCMITEVFPCPPT